MSSLKKEDNEWDYKIVPMISLKYIEPLKIKKRNIKTTQSVISTMTHAASKTEQSLKLQIRRARQIAYIEPWFQEFLQPALKGHLFIASIGQAFWVIGAYENEYASNFRFYQREVRSSLEAHLNRISKGKKWHIPDFKIKTFPRKNKIQMIEIAKAEPKNALPLSIRDNRTLLASQSKKSLDEWITILKEGKMNGS